MKRKNKTVEPIPESFKTGEEAANFWDAHDTTDYEADFSDVDIKVQFKGRRFEIDVDEDVMSLLKKESHRKHLPVRRIANYVLRKNLARSYG